jgi:DNA-binding transcriptional LysR family regulator
VDLPPKNTEQVMLEQMRTLEAIVRTGSFSAAARDLHKAQSAVSYGVQQLELRLDVELFDRTGHRAVLTDAGHAILAEGRKLLEAADRIEDLARRIGDEWEPRLEIVIDGILPQYPIMRILKALADEGSPTQIQVKVEFLGGVEYRFEQENADIMLVKDYVARASDVSVPLADIESALVCSPTHPLSSRRSVTNGDLHEYVELSIHDSSNANASPDPTSFGGSRIFYLSDFETKRKALQMGLGFGWLPLYLAEEPLREGVLVEVDYEAGSRYSFAPQLVYRATRLPGRTARRFVELLTDTVEESWTG